jgi:hypothetical protein
MGSHPREADIAGILAQGSGRRGGQMQWEKGNFFMEIYTRLDGRAKVVGQKK